MDFLSQLRVNKLCSHLGLEMPFPFLDPAELQDPDQSSSYPSYQLPVSGGNSVQQQQPLEDADVVPEVFPADWDEELLLGSDSDEEELEAADAALASWQQQQHQEVPVDATGSATGVVAEQVMPGLPPCTPKAEAVAPTTADVPATANGLAAPACHIGNRWSSRPSPVKPSATAPTSINPGGRLKRVAAGVALSVARELCNNDTIDSDDDLVGREHKRQCTAAPSSSDDSHLQEEDDTDMADADNVKRPSSAQKRQRQQPAWLAKSIVTRLASGECIRPVVGDDEE